MRKLPKMTIRHSFYIYSMFILQIMYLFYILLAFASDALRASVEAKQKESAAESTRVRKEVLQALHDREVLIQRMKEFSEQRAAAMRSGDNSVASQSYQSSKSDKK